MILIAVIIGESTVTNPPDQPTPWGDPDQLRWIGWIRCAKASGSKGGIQYFGRRDFNCFQLYLKWCKWCIKPS